MDSKNDLTVISNLTKTIFCRISSLHDVLTYLKFINTGKNQTLMTSRYTISIFIEMNKNQEANNKNKMMCNIFINSTIL